MNAGVVYYSKTGNTKKVAEAIGRAAECLVVRALEEKMPEKIDVLFLGAAVYATYDHGLSPVMIEFINHLDPSDVGKVVLFATGFSGNAITIMKGLLEQKGISVDPESFWCKGAFFLFSMGHPNLAEIRQAEEFARQRI